jgi:hypothetical protein
LKKSPAATVRDAPSGPRTTKLAPSATITVPMSPAGSACAMDPPIVPTWRTCGSPTCCAVSATIGAACCSTSLLATS